MEFKKFLAGGGAAAVPGGAGWGRLLYRLLRWNPWVDVLCRAVEVLQQQRFP